MPASWTLSPRRGCGSTASPSPARSMPSSFSLFASDTSQDSSGRKSVRTRPLVRCGVAVDLGHGNRRLACNESEQRYFPAPGNRGGGMARRIVASLPRVTRTTRRWHRHRGCQHHAWGGPSLSPRPTWTGKPARKVRRCSCPSGNLRAECCRLGVGGPPVGCCRASRRQRIAAGTN